MHNLGILLVILWIVLLLSDSSNRALLLVLATMGFAALFVVITILFLLNIESYPESWLWIAVSVELAIIFTIYLIGKIRSKNGSISTTLNTPGDEGSKLFNRLTGAERGE